MPRPGQQQCALNSQRRISNKHMMCTSDQLVLCRGCAGTYRCTLDAKQCSAGTRRTLVQYARRAHSAQLRPAALRYVTSAGRRRKSAQLMHSRFALIRMLCTYKVYDLCTVESLQKNSLRINSTMVLFAGEVHVASRHSHAGLALQCQCHALGALVTHEYSSRLVKCCAHRQQHTLMCTWRARAHSPAFAYKHKLQLLLIRTASHRQHLQHLSHSIPGASSPFSTAVRRISASRSAAHGSGTARVWRRARILAGLRWRPSQGHVRPTARLQQFHFLYVLLLRRALVGAQQQLRLRLRVRRADLHAAISARAAGPLARLLARSLLGRRARDETDGDAALASPGPLLRAAASSAVRTQPPLRLDLHHHLCLHVGAGAALARRRGHAVAIAVGARATRLVVIRVGRQRARGAARRRARRGRPRDSARRRPLRRVPARAAARGRPAERRAQTAVVERCDTATERRAGRSGGTRARAGARAAEQSARADRRNQCGAGGVRAARRLLRAALSVAVARTRALTIDVSCCSATHRSIRSSLYITSTCTDCTVQCSQYTGQLIVTPEYGAVRFLDVLKSSAPRIQVALLVANCPLLHNSLSHPHPHVPFGTHLFTCRLY